MDSLYPPPNCGPVRTSRFRRWHRSWKDLFCGVVSGAWRFVFFVRATIVHRRISRWTAGCAVLKSAPSGREELNRRHARALSVSFEFESPRSPTWTSPQLTTSAFLESLSLYHVLCECHNNGQCRHERRHPFLVLRICLHSDTHRQSHWKGSCDHTANSSSQSPMLSATRSPKQASEGAQSRTRE